MRALILTSPSLGTYLGCVAYVPLWSRCQSMDLGAAITFPNFVEAAKHMLQLKAAAGLPPDCLLIPIEADLQHGGHMFASHRACALQGHGWLLTASTICYGRMQ